MEPPGMPHAQQRNKALLPFLPTIRQSSLFRNIEPDDLEAMLGCINAQKSSYDKGEIILNSGSLNSKMGLVLEGVVRVEQCDCWGNRSIIATFAEGQSFGEVYACSPELPLDVDVVAANKTSILIMDVGRITTLCPHTCTFHTQFIRNLLDVIAMRTYTLTRKIYHLSKRNTRTKLLSFLSDCAKQTGSLSFDIPFNRQELADYLSVERSAMCAELSRMKHEGIVDYRKNHFHLRVISEDEKENL